MHRTAPLWTSLLCLLATHTASAQTQTSQSLWHDGQRRTYLVRHPRTPPPGPRPVWLLLHGAGQTGARLARLLPCDEIADRHGVILLYPDALDGQWNDGRGVDRSGDTAITAHDDVGFLDRLLDHATRRLNADPQRIYATGVSNGGLMTFRYAIESGERLAAAAAIVANLPEPLALAQPRAPLPILIMNGTDDPFVPHQGGTSQRHPRAGRVLSTHDTLDFWVRNNGGAASTRLEDLPDLHTDDHSNVQRTTVQTGSGLPVVLYEVQGGGHTIPSTDPGRDLPRLFGHRNRDIDAIETIWAFLHGDPPPPAPVALPRRASLDGYRSGSLDHDGRRRTFSLRLPTSTSPASPPPVVIVLHGGMEGVGVDVARLTGLGEACAREEFVAIYPDGIDGQWNDGRGVSLREGVDVTQVDDVGFVAALIDRVVPLLNGDPRRVYLLGISNGSMLAHRCGVEIGERLAAIATVIGHIPEQVARHAPAHPLPVLILSGTEDTFMPFDGGQAIAGDRPVGAVRSAVATAEFWANANGGVTARRTEQLPDLDPRDRTRTLRTELDTASGAPVVLYAVHGGGHYLHGDDTQELPRVFGRKSRDLDGPQVILTWLRSRTR